MDGKEAERRSLSAEQAAKPQVGPDEVNCNLDKLEFTSPNGGIKPPLRQTEALPKDCLFWSGMIEGTRPCSKRFGQDLRH